MNPPRCGPLRAALYAIAIAGALSTAHHLDSRGPDDVQAEADTLRALQAALSSCRTPVGGTTYTPLAGVAA